MGKKLFTIDKENYGKDYEQHYLEQYKLYLQSTDYISDRRMSSIKFFLTISTALLSIIGLSIRFFEKTDNLILFLISVIVTGIFVCIIFLFLICSYKKLNAVKFEVLEEIEAKLPLSPYPYEWEKLKARKKYLEFTDIEKYIPIAFGLIYIIIIVYLCSEQLPSLLLCNN